MGDFEYEWHDSMFSDRILRRCHGYRQFCAKSIIQQQLSAIMKSRTLQRQQFHETPTNKSRARPSAGNQKLQTVETYRQMASLRTKTYSFQDVPRETLNQFCHHVHEIHALLNVGKRMTDPNVLMMNSTQKQLVEMIIDNNKHANDQKSKYLTQRAGKYIKLLWKTQKFNDSLLQRPPKIEKSEPHYASPIHNFKKGKIATNTSLSPFSHQTDRSISKKKSNKVEPGISSRSNQNTSRTKRIHSEDQKFSNVRLNKFDKKGKNGKKGQQQKSFEVDLTRSIAWKTMNTTRNFENMLKILKKQQ